MSPISSDLPAIVAGAKKLNSSIDDSTELVRQLDAVLAASTVCVEARIPDIHRERGQWNPEDPRIGESIYDLIFGRTDESRWAIAVAATFIADGAESPRKVVWTRPVVSVTRSLRKIAIARIPELIRVLRETIDRASDDSGVDTGSLASAIAEIRAAFREVPSGSIGQRMRDRARSSGDEERQRSIQGVLTAKQPARPEPEHAEPEDPEIEEGRVAGRGWARDKKNPKSAVRRMVRHFETMVGTNDFDSYLESDNACGVGSGVYRHCTGEEWRRSDCEEWWSWQSNKKDAAYSPEFVRGFIEGVLEAAPDRLG